MFEKETASKDLSENHREDFKKCLKKRATDHSQFYQRLSNASIVAPKTQSKPDVFDNNIASKNMMFHHRFYEKNDHSKDYDCDNENLTEFELNEMKIINSKNNNNDNNSNDDDDDNESNNKIDNNRNLKNIDTNCNSNVSDYNHNNCNKNCEVDILNKKKLSENISKCLSNDSSKNCEKLKITNNGDVATASSVVVNSLDIEKCAFNEERSVMCNLLSNDNNDVLKFLKNNKIHQVFLDDNDDNTMISNVETNQDCGYHQYLCHNVNKNNNKIEIISSIEINDDQIDKIKKNSSNEFDKNTTINNTVHTNIRAIDQSIKKVFNKQNVSTDNESNESSNFDNDILLIRKVNIDNDNYVGDGSGDGGGVISEKSNYYMKSSGIILNDDDNDNDNRQQPHDNNHNGGFNFKKSFNFNNNNNSRYYNKNENVKTYTLTTETEGNIILASTSSNKNIVNTIEKYSNNNDEYECDENSEPAKSMMLMAMANKKLNNNNNHNNNNNNKNDYNKNKMNEGEQWNDSNYFRFIPVGSFDDDRLDRTARWCCSRDIIAERNSNNSSSSSSSRSANKNLESAAKEQHFERYLRDTVNSFANNIPEDQNIDEYNTFDFYNIDKYKAKSTIINYNKDYNIVNFNCIQKEPENRIKFPCVEKLVKMYTKLLQEQDKKTEDNMEIKAEENETNIKLKCDDDSKKCKNQKKIRQSDSLKLKATGDRSDLNRTSPVSDEGCPVGQSPYSSDYDDNEPVMSKGIETETEIENIPNKDKVMRSSSSDSALGLDDECQGTERPASPPPPSANTGRRMTLTVADIPLRPTLLPLAEPTKLPDSSTNTDQYSSSTGAFLTQTAVPSKVLLEERVVEIPEDRFGSLSSSRRESAQSCFSDYNSEYGGVRYVRTPSVVVSDYSDDVMCGITLEEIEYFRAHRMRRRSSADTAATEKDDTASDVSAASSCSNLYYCGSTISALDGADCYVNGMRMPIIDRKISDCSTCSTASGEEDDDHYFTLPSDYSQQQHHHYQQDNSFAEQQQQQQQDQVEQQIQQKIRKHKKVGEQILN